MTKQTKKQRKQDQLTQKQAEKLGELNERLAVHLKALSGQAAKADIVLPDHQINTSKLNLAMQGERQDPMLKLLADSIEQFSKQHQRAAIAVKMPMHMLLHIIGLATPEEQQAFWDADIKRLAGLLVGTTEDGTLVLK